MFADETKLVRRESALCTAAGESVLMMDIDTGRYYELDGPAAHVWHALEQPVTFGTLCSGLQQRFDVDAERCRDDTARFVDKLIRLSLVERT